MTRQQTIAALTALFITLSALLVSTGTVDIGIIIGIGALVLFSVCSAVVLSGAVHAVKDYSRSHS